MHRGGVCSTNKKGDRKQRKLRRKHPTGLTGKELGLWYAKNGKVKKEKQDINNRSVISLDKQHEENITELLQYKMQDAACSSTQCDNEISVITNLEDSRNDTHSQNSHASSYDIDKNVIMKDDEDIVWNIDNATFDYNETQLCGLREDNSFDKKLFTEMHTRLQNSQYENMLEFRKKLPSYNRKEELLQMISSNQVIVVSGETGCGKTTQVPQFILDDYIKRQIASTCHIVCTQPKRISAISVAERVAAERGEQCGLSCGYQIRLECKLPRERGSILYCTTGVLLRRLIGDPYLSQVSHVIIDEIHERDVMTDFLLVVIRDLLPHRPDLKVILMSATLNAKLFSLYFNNSPMQHIPGFTYLVKEFLLEDIIEMTRYELWPSSKKEKNFKIFGRGHKAAMAQQREEEELYYEYLQSIEQSYHWNTVDTLKAYDFQKIDNQLILKLIKYICHELGDGAILIFLPGWNEISSLHELLMENPVFSSAYYVIIPLHSMMPTTNQREVFERPPVGVRKIIIATNIAETSITIDDVVFVIDSGKIKEKSYDVETDVSCLKSVWISKASAKQRCGRAGRVQSGYCFHLYTTYHFKKFQDYQLPEMLRTPLDSLCLQIKILRLGKIWKFLLKAMECPQYKAVTNAIRSLTQMRALDGHEELTALGYHLAKLPVTPKVGRMILFGAIFSCLDPVLTIAASLDFKEPFFIPIHKEKEASVRRQELAKNSKSDHIMLVNAFKGWEEAKRFGAEAAYCRRNFLSINILKMIYNMRKQFAQHLNEIGFFKSSDVKNIYHNKNSENVNLIKAVLCAGLYPNVAKIVVNPNSKRPPKLFTKEFGRVAIHPKSVNSYVTEYESQWLIYHEKMKTSKLYLFDTSMISPFPLLFFGGQITVHQENGMDTIEVEKGIKFHSPMKIALLVKNLRHELDILLNRKIKNPTMQLTVGYSASSHEAKILQAIIDLITTEKVKTKVESGYK